MKSAKQSRSLINTIKPYIYKMLGVGLFFAAITFSPLPFHVSAAFERSDAIKSARTAQSDIIVSENEREYDEEFISSKRHVREIKMQILKPFSVTQHESVQMLFSGACKHLFENKRGIYLVQYSRALRQYSIVDGFWPVLYTRPILTIQAGTTVEESYRQYTDGENETSRSSPKLSAVVAKEYEMYFHSFLSELPQELNAKGGIDVTYWTKSGERINNETKYFRYQ